MTNNADYNEYTGLTRRMLLDSDRTVQSKVRAAISASDNERIMMDKLDAGEITFSDYIAISDYAVQTYEDAVDYFSKVLRGRGTNLDAEIINIEHQ